MKSSRLILLLGFGTLLILIGLLALSAFWRAERIYADVSAIRDSYQKSSTILNTIRSDIYRAALLMRDYIIDQQAATGGQYRNDFVELRSSMESHLADLHALVGSSIALSRMRQEIDSYWTSLNPILEWTPQQRVNLGFEFLRNQVRPRRQAMLQLTQEIDKLIADGLLKEEQVMQQSQAAFRRYLGGMFLVSLILALMVAGVSIFRISRLERHSEVERRRIENAEQELRYLSQRLVHAQEEERRSISRELHDEIGQKLTGLRLELRSLEELYETPGPAFQKHISEIKNIAETTMRAVRDLAMGLRPSMLDDLGLGPALEWQAREFSRRNGIPAIVEIDGNLDGIPENVRTCVYRVVQESLTNCARHAQAQNVRITLHGGSSDLIAAIRDDGIGFYPGKQASRGIGLIGMEERTRELGGRIVVASQPGRGTTVEIAIPLARNQLQ